MIVDVTTGFAWKVFLAALMDAVVAGRISVHDARIDEICAWIDRPFCTYCDRDVVACEHWWEANGGVS